MRLSAYAVAGSRLRPLSVISRTAGATRSAKVLEPGSRQVNSSVVVEAKVPWSGWVALVRSRSMVYDVTSRRAARVAASSRVRLVPGMRASCHREGP